MASSKTEIQDDQGWGSIPVSRQRVLRRIGPQARGIFSLLLRMADIRTMDIGAGQERIAHISGHLLSQISSFYSWSQECVCNYLAIARALDLIDYSDDWTPDQPLDCRISLGPYRPVSSLKPLGALKTQGKRLATMAGRVKTRYLLYMRRTTKREDLSAQQEFTITKNLEALSMTISLLCASLTEVQYRVLNFAHSHTLPLPPAPEPEMSIAGMLSFMADLRIVIPELYRSKPVSMSKHDRKMQRGEQALAKQRAFEESLSRIGLPDESTPTSMPTPTSAATTNASTPAPAEASERWITTHDWDQLPDEPPIRQRTVLSEASIARLRKAKFDEDTIEQLMVDGIPDSMVRTFFAMPPSDDELDEDQSDT